ncbi:MAG TPA: nucleoside monophosphate kinase [Candidatus Saccharimonadales bacterium]|nr:nucleoside monophosphate kinase [Candidatus Saccharimonadales bacterium]
MEKNETLSTKEKQKAILRWLGTGSINVFGRPFAGKDVQCSLINAWMGTEIIGGGDIIRTQEEAAHLRESHDKGQLAPTDEFLALVTRYFSRDEFDGKPIILSSIGRWDGEQKPICDAAAEAGHPTKAVIYIDITEETVLDRFEKSGNRGRGDDNTEVLATRLNEFREKTMPVIQDYEQRDMLVRVKGDQPPEQVQQEIVNKLYELSQKSL